MSRRVLHLVRGGDPDTGAVDLLHDCVVRRDGAGWCVDTAFVAAPGSPPARCGPIDDDALVQLLLTADLVAVW